MHITAKYFDNVYEFDVEPSDWLLSLKKKISAVTHLATDEVQIMIGDKILHLEKKLSYYGIEEGTELYVFKKKTV
ncbi:uncharacterized protein [Blastocystis hominis]|uniref:Ubiquitin-like domain-containing protein n=1 Tax=Blastocystis hominis TaxID=12968 RepID=D8M3Y0_BLAHO|nr:uncharacterized protein [Blastocystis hominis]CBK22603.2 unnamed protein product [Blastocystis hominis]|eukprot:XP_012896651.1 uncharacterized protein [Blastocystis hominis]